MSFFEKIYRDWVEQLTDDKLVTIERKGYVVVLITGTDGAMRVREFTQEDSNIPNRISVSIDEFGSVIFEEREPEKVRESLRNVSWSFANEVEEQMQVRKWSK